VNETPLDYLTNWRIRQAEKLLLSDDFNIEIVAESVGYQSASAFSRIFKAKTGQTPAAYRKHKAKP
jgi:AraC-like DNA-binding protein